MGLQWAGPPAPYQVVTLGGQGWRPVQTCSLEDPATPPLLFPEIMWRMHHQDRNASLVSVRITVATDISGLRK